MEVAKAERRGGFVATGHQFEEIVGDARRDLLRSFPRRPAAALVLFVAQQGDDVVVCDFATIERRPEGTEFRFDLFAAPDQVIDDIGGELVGSMLDRQKLELAPREFV